MPVNEMTWEFRFKMELEKAENARKMGKEGMARVLARRAAGIVADEYLRKTGSGVEAVSAYDLLKALFTHPAIDEETRLTTGHFLERVNPDFNLPIQADLLADARWLAKKLLQVDIL